MNPATESSPPAPAPVHPAPTTRPKRTAKPGSVSSRPGLKPAAIGIACALGLFWLGRFAFHAYHYVETENAYVVGHIHQVSAQIEGQVKEVLVQDNQDVKAGDVLVRLDPLEFELAVQKAKAGLAQARGQETQTVSAVAQAGAQLAEAEARVTQADAQIAQARAQFELAQLTLARNEKLFHEGGAVTQADVDNTRSGSQVAQAAFTAATANHTAAQAAVGSAEAAQKSAQAEGLAAGANVSAAEAAVGDAVRRLGYATVTAPTDGRIGNKNVEPGNRVSAGQSLLALAEPAPWIIANFKETQLPLMQVGQTVEITVDALPGLTLPGRIDSLAPASGAQFALLPPDNATGNFNKVVQRVPVKIVLDPATLAQLGGRLRLGYSVIVNVRVR